MKPVFFSSPSELRKWFEQYHKKAQELWVGFYKMGSGRQSVTMPEAEDERGSVERLQVTASVLPEDSRILGGKCEERGDEVETARHFDSILGEGRDNPTTDQTESLDE